MTPTTPPPSNYDETYAEMLLRMERNDSGRAPRAARNPASKKLKKLLAIACLASLPGSLLAAGPAPVDLGSAAHFTILAGAAITTTGGGIVNGDVGTSPISGSAIHLMQAQVHGIIYTVDQTGPAGSIMAPALLTAAKGDLTTAFNDAAGRTPVPSGPFLNPGSGNIGGLNLVPGLYKFTGTAMVTGSNLTLTGGPDDVWIFQIASNLDVGTTVQVILAGGAQARNIFWQVGTSATIGTGAMFKGTILADQSITMGSTSSLDGRALAFSAGVTFDGVVGQLPTPKAPTFLSVAKPDNDSATVVLKTTPYYQVTLQSSSLKVPITWTTVTTSIPTSTPWVFTDNNAQATNQFYRAYLTIPN
jgi:hypothetical protein